MHRWALPAALLLVVAIPAVAQNAQPVTLTYQHTIGETVTYDWLVTGSYAIVTTSPGGGPSASFGHEMAHLTCVQRCTALGPANEASLEVAVPALFRRYRMEGSGGAGVSATAWDGQKVSLYHDDAPQELGPREQALQGWLTSPIPVKQARNGQVVVGAGFDQVLSAVFGTGVFGLVDLWQLAARCGVLPGSPVAVNETWTRDLRLETQGETGPLLIGTCTGRLDGVEGGQDRVRAWVSQYAALTLQPSAQPPADAANAGGPETVALRVYCTDELDLLAHRLITRELSVVEDAELSVPFPAADGGQGLAHVSIRGARMHATITARPPVAVPDE